MNLTSDLCHYFKVNFSSWGTKISNINIDSVTSQWQRHSLEKFNNQNRANSFKEKVHFYFQVS